MRFGGNSKRKWGGRQLGSDVDAYWVELTFIADFIAEATADKVVNLSMKSLISFSVFELLAFDWKHSG